ncbi:AAA family ATPase [Ovoidimarina sediminis]|uniref:AAA family ATPase n=1 Tax=Ovoidimarina sediminis TaxID=3079856 RepID=UPI00291424BB|nr:AAA family ATPase [Rhodophyticola sp. MJ-SS7]MDU8946030.1 AAA family ATPase [Rhodophyticola sp. MJ-SS7]
MSKASNKSIVLVTKNPDATPALREALATMSNVAFDERNATLTELNGSSHALAKVHDVIFFRSEGDVEQDLKAIEEIKKSSRNKAEIVAIASDSTSLADVRKLTAAGVKEVFPDSISADELRGYVNNLIQQREAAAIEGARSGMRLELGKVITVTQARGGVGSTTVAVNLADSLQTRQGRKTEANRVVIVDLDIQFGAVGSFLEVPPANLLYNVAVDGGEIDAMMVEQSLTKMDSGLHVLAAPDKFAPLEALKPEHVESLISILKERFDYVVLDLPRALVDWLAPLLDATDRMLLVTDSAVPSIRQARRLIDFYTEDKLDLQIDIVINHEKKPLVQKRHHAEASKLLERPFLHWIPEDPSAAREALDRGVPLTAVARRSALAKSIGRLGQATIAALANSSSDTEDKHQA